MNVSRSRRQFLTNVALSAGGLAGSSWFRAFGEEIAQATEPKRHCILLWMSGGPTQTDTFDMKPQHDNGGEFSEIATAAPGLRFSEHLPKLAKHGERLAPIRSLSTKEGDHGRGTYLMRTGRPPMGAIQYPSLGASLSNQLTSVEKAALPGNVAIGAFRALNQDAFGPGFLGPRFGPLMVGASDMGGARNDANGFPILKVDALERPGTITEKRMTKRLELWEELQSEFLAARRLGAPKTHRTVYQSAVNLMNSEDAAAFDLSKEPEALREAYGKTVFGQGCLLARRLIERGVSFVEVTLGGGAGWDTHANNFDEVKTLSEQLDAGWATLMTDLDQRGLLDQTTILWMGEFGRTPQINPAAGRDHFPNAWTCVLGGGGIAGGQAYGKTSDDGMEVVEDKVGVQDVLATVCKAVGVSPETHQMSNTGRPIPIMEGWPIDKLLS